MNFPKQILGTPHNHFVIILLKFGPMPAIMKYCQCTEQMYNKF